MTRYEDLPESVVWALVTAIGNFDMTVEERRAAVVHLGLVPVSKAVRSDVESVCERVRCDRDYPTPTPA